MANSRDFRITANLDLNTKDAEAAIKKLQNQKIKATLEVQGGVYKQAMVNATKAVDQAMTVSGKKRIEQEKKIASESDKATKKQVNNAKTLISSREEERKQAEKNNRIIEEGSKRSLESSKKVAQEEARHLENRVKKEKEITKETQRRADIVNGSKKIDSRTNDEYLSEFDDKDLKKRLQYHHKVRELNRKNRIEQNSEKRKEYADQARHYERLLSQQEKRIAEEAKNDPLAGEKFANLKTLDERMAPRKTRQAALAEMAKMEEGAHSTMIALDKLESSQAKDVAKNIRLTQRAENLADSVNRKKKSGSTSTTLGMKSDNLKADLKVIQELDKKSIGLAKDFEKAEKSINSFGDARVSKNASNLTNNLKEMWRNIDKSTPEKAREGLEKIGRELGNISTKATDLNKTKQVFDQYSKLSSQFTRQDNKYTDAFNENLQKRLDSVLENNRLGTKSGDGRILSSFKEIDGHGKAVNKLGSLSSKVDTIVNPAVAERAGKIRDNLTGMYTTIQKNNLSSSSKQMHQFVSEIEKGGAKLKQLNSVESVANRLDSVKGVLKPSQVNSLKKEIVGLSRSAHIGTGKFEADLTRVKTKINSLSRYRGSLQTFKKDLKSSMLGHSLGYMAGSAIRATYKGITGSYAELDASMTNIKKVADSRDVATVEQIRKITSDSIAIAKEVGMSSADVQNALASSIQAGMGSMEASMKVARKSMILANVGDMDKDEATSSINTIIKSFNLEPLRKVKREVGGTITETDELSESLDLVNHAGNNFAISSEGVASALARGGGVLHEYGVSLKDSVGLITAANEPLQNPEQVGNGLRTIAMRMSGVAFKAKDGTVALNNTGQALKDIAGIDVFANKGTGEIKNMVTILDELQGKWSSLRDDERLALSEQLAGKNRANVLAGLMGNYETFKKVREDFSNNEHIGSAERENKKYVQSFAGNMNRLSETLKGIGTALIGSEDINSFLTGLNKGLEGVSNIAGKISKANMTTPAVLGLLAGGIDIKRSLGDREISYEQLLNKKRKRTKDKSPLDAFRDQMRDAIQLESEYSERQRERAGVTKDLNKLAEEGIEYNVREAQFKSDIHGSDSEEVEKEIDSKKKRNEVEKEANEIRYKSKKAKDEVAKANERAINSEREVQKAKKRTSKVISENTNRIAKNSEMAEQVRDHVSTMGSEEMPVQRTSGKIKDKFKGYLGKKLGMVKGFVGSALATITGAGLSFLAVGATTAALRVVKRGYDELATGHARRASQHKEEREEAIENLKASKDNLTFVKQNQEAIDGLAKRKKALLAIDEKSRTAEQSQELVKLKDMEAQLAQRFPELIRGYDTSGNPIFSLTTGAKTLTSELERSIKKKEKLVDLANSRVYKDNITKMFHGEKIGLGTLEKAKRSFDLLERGRELYARKGVKQKEKETAYGKITKGFFFDHKKSFKTLAKDYQKEYSKWVGERDEEYRKLGESIAEYDEANMFNRGVQLEKLQKGKAYNNVGTKMQDAISRLSNNFNWGKIKRPRQAMDVLEKMTKSGNVGKINELSKAIEDLNETYRVDKDYDEYSKGMDKIANSWSKMTGKSARQLKKNIMDVNRGFANTDEEDEFNYLKKRGVRYSDLDKENAKGVYADTMIKKYQAVKELQEDLLDSEATQEERKSIINSASQDENLGKGLRNMAKSLSKTKTLTDSASRAFVKMTKGVTDFDPKSKEARKNIEGIAEALTSGKIEGDLPFINGLEMAKEELEALLKSGITGKDFMASFEENIDPNIAKRIDKFYSKYRNGKGEKIRIPLEVEAEFSKLNLLDDELESIEKMVEHKKMDENEANNFRLNGGKYFKGTNGDYKQALHNMADTDQGIKDAFRFGIISDVEAVDDRVKGLNSTFKSLGETLGNDVLQLNANEFIPYLRMFEDMDQAAQNLAKTLNANTLDQLNSVRESSKILGQVNGTSKQGADKTNKTVKVVVESVGWEGLDRVNQILANVPDEKKIEIQTILQGENGGAFARSLDFLMKEGGSSEVVRKVLDIVVQGDGKYEDLLKLSERELKELIIKAKLEDAEAKRKANELERDGKKKVTVETETSSLDEVTKPREVPVSFKMPKLGASTDLVTPKIDIKNTKSKIKVSVEADTSKAEGQIKSIGAEKEVTIRVNAKTSEATKAVGATIKSISDKTATVTVVDNASKPANKATKAYRAFPEKDKTNTVTTIDNSSARSNAAANAWARIPADGSVKRLTVVTTYQTNGSPSGIGARGRAGAPSISRPNKKKIFSVKDVITDKVKARNSQIDNTYGGAMSVAGATSIGSPLAGATTSAMAASVASPTGVDYAGLASNFEVQKLPGYDYKQLTYIDRLKYSMDEMKRGFKEGVDVLHEMDIAVGRVSKSIEILGKRISRARGARKVALLELQRHQMREQKRRLKNQRDINEQVKLYYRSKMKENGFSFANNGAITGNYVKKMLAFKERMGAIDKEIEKLKEKNTENKRKQLEEEKELIQEKIKMLEAYEAVINKEMDIDSAIQDIDNSIEENIEDQERVRLNAFKEYMGSIIRELELGTKRISHTLEIYSIKMKNAFGTERLELIDAQIDGFHEMRGEISQNISALEGLKSQLKSKLSGYGFQFNGDEISNYAQHLAQLHDTSAYYDEISSMCNDYFDIYSDRIPALQQQLEEFEGKIKDAQRQRLEDAKEVEEKIMAMLRKESDERIKLAEKEAKKREELLNKKKEEYNEARKEAEYQESYKEKIKEIEEIEKKREIYRKDTSQKGQKELQKLNKEYEEKMKALKKFTEDHLADKVNKSIDDEIESIQDKVDKIREDEEKKVEDSVLLQKAQEAIESGYIELENGGRVDLNSALMDYMDKYEGGLGAMGALEKAELESKLHVAENLAEIYDSVLDSIGIGDFSSGGYIDYAGYDRIKEDNSMIFNYNSPLVNIEGSVDTDSYDRIERAVREAIEENNRMIAENLR